MREVTLIEILTAREDRAMKQRALLAKHGCPLLCFTMNIAGPIKTNPLVERAFRRGISFLEEAILPDKIREKEVRVLPTGCEAFLSVDMAAEEIKRVCVEIEEATPLGRLFDMDVLDTDGRKLDRKNERGCIVCGKVGRSCSAGRLHSVEELQKVTHDIMHSHFKSRDMEKLSIIAAECLIDEVKTTPKPGLVDMKNNGSHSDMDIDSFVKSANALTSYFCSCAKLGCEMRESSPDSFFTVLRQEGLSAEKRMYAATGGVNTHKGAIYSLGVICGAIGRLWTSAAPIADTEEILKECAVLVKAGTKRDFENIDTSTAGGRIYLSHGFRGIRGEVADGFPSVLKISLPVYEKALEKGYSENDAGVIALLHLIANVNDTTLYNRGGIDAMEYAKSAARVLLSKSPCPDKKDIESLDDAFIKKNLSPGGCADLLAVTYFLSKIKRDVR